MMNEQDKAFTNAWWEKLLADDERMIRWLQKLQQTEYDGYTGNIEANEKWGGGHLGAANIFRVTGDDELRHSDMLVELLHKRGASTTEKQPESIYWEEMDRIITDLPTCAAVFHLGEVLAADRFQVLIEHPNTPPDIYAFLESALPDEEYHGRAFRRISTPAAIELVMVKHIEMIGILKGQK